MRGLLLSALALALGASGAAAQVMRPFSTYRQWHGETRHRGPARVRGRRAPARRRAGRTSCTGWTCCTTTSAIVPVSDFDAARGNVTLGLRAAGQRRASRRVQEPAPPDGLGDLLSPERPRARGRRSARWTGTSSSAASGSPRLDLEAGASRATVRFSQPNAARCRAATLSAGAAELTVLGLGNSRCDRIAFEGGVGRVTLDFGGAWTSSSAGDGEDGARRGGAPTAAARWACGSRWTSSSPRSSPQGLVRRGNSYLSPGYDQATRHLDIDVTTAVGGVTVDWLE